MISLLTPTHSYAAGALLALALRQAQIHQTSPLGSSNPSDEGGRDILIENDDTKLWTAKRCGLLRPVFRFLGIDSKAWAGLEETALSASIKHHIGAFLRVLSEESHGSSQERMDQELALVKSVDVMAMSLEMSSNFDESSTAKQDEYEEACHKRCSDSQSQSSSNAKCPPERTILQTKTELLSIGEEFPECLSAILDHNLVVALSYSRKIAVLYELLSACIADIPDNGKTFNGGRNGYDARHRVALRLLAAWFDVKWSKMEAMEIMVAFSTMAAIKEAEVREKESALPQDKWSRWKRGGIIGAAALTGGTLLAITGGLAAPAIAAGFGALAPTLGALIPVIGASGFAAVAGAAGSIAGSVAVAASLGAAGAGLSGYKMARRIGNVDEFEFIPIGQNHNQGRLAVGILVTGFVLDEEDFIKPWGQEDGNLERYALKWETKNLIAVSTAIQDWLTSKITMELMRQGAMMTVLSSILTALAWPAALLGATNFIDNHWAVALDRSDKAGKLLAEVLLQGLQGNRPVTLVGFSMGARVIFTCLQHLAQMGDKANGLIERVVLLGAPLPLRDEDWLTARKIVAGRFVNVYSTSDWTLGVAFRASLLTKGLAGIQSVDIPGVENVDVTEQIEGHSSYLWNTLSILNQLELDTYYPVFSKPPKP